MQFNTQADGLDLYTDARFWLGIETGDGGSSADTTTYPLKMFARNSNRALDKCTVLALKSDGIWQYDDFNNASTELVDITTALVSGTKKYAIAVTWLKIARIRIKDSTGNWTTLEKKDRRQWSDSQMGASSGTPHFYDVMGNWIYFDCAPNWSQAASLEVQFQRGPSYFVYGDTTKTPGFATPFHTLISMMAALDFAEANDMNARAATLRDKIGKAPDLENNEPGSGMLKEFCDYYSARDEDGAPNISMQQDDYGQDALSNDLGSSPKGW